MKRLTLILWLCLCATAGAAPWWQAEGLYTDTIEISSLPYTASQSRTLYTFSGDLWTDGSGVTVAATADSSCFDGGGTVTLTIDSNLTDGNGVVWGESAFIMSGATNVRITGLTLRQGMADSNGVTLGGTYGGDSAMCIAIPTGSPWLTVDSCNLYVYGHDAQCIQAYSPGGCKGIEVFGNYMENNALSFRDRQYPCAAVTFPNSASIALASLDTFSINIHDNTVGMSHHTGILCGAKARIYNNDITIDAYNDWFTLDSNTYSWGNAHGCAEKGGFWPGSIMRKNTVRCGTTYYGGRGFYVGTGSYGTAASPIIVDSNTALIWCGYSGRFGGDPESPDARGMRLRYGLQHVKVRYNTLITFTDDDTATQYMNAGGHGIWFNDDLEDNDSQAVGIEFIGNDIRNVWLGDPTDALNQRTACLMITQMDSGSYAPYADDNFSKNNAYRTTAINLMLSTDGGYGHCDEWRSYRDSFFNWYPDSAWVDSVTESAIQVADPITSRLGWGYCSGNARKTATVAGWGYMVEVRDAEIIDPYYGSGLTWDSTGPQNGSGDKYLRFARTVKVTVTDSSAQPVNGATVKIINENRADTTSLTTNASGICYDTTDIRAISWSGCSETTDTTFSLKFLAIANGDTITVTDTLDVTTTMGADYAVTMANLAAGEGGGTTRRKQGGGKITGGRIR